MSKTKPQIYTHVGFNGELPRRRGLNASYYSKIPEMRRDPTIALARAMVVAPSLASQWSIESKKEAPPGASDLISRTIMPLRLEFLRRSMLGMIDYGWQPFEKIFWYDEQNRHLILYELKPLLQDYTDILVDENTGAFAGVVNNVLNSNDVILVPNECFVASMDVEGTDWYGSPLLKNAEAAYDEGLVIEGAAARYDKKIAGARIVIKYPQGSSMVAGVETDNFVVAQALARALESVGTVAIPTTITEMLDTLNAQSAELTQWKIELLSDTQSAAAFAERLGYVDKKKVRAFELPERAVLEGQFGTKAEAEAHADFALVNMDIRHRLFVQQVNKQIVNQLLRLNYGEEYEDLVYVQPAPITDTTLQFLRKLYETIMGTEGSVEMAIIDREQLRDRLGVPTRPEFDDPGYQSEVQNLVDNILNQTISEADPQVQALADQIVRTINGVLDPGTA